MLEEALSSTNKSEYVCMIWWTHLLATETISVVTGKGSHSSGGVAKIKPAVLEYLNRKGYRYDDVASYL